MAKVATGEVKAIPWDPLTGVQDNRSHPAEMVANSFRLILNWFFPDERSPRRRPGFTKLLNSTHNADLHDQLISLQNFYQGTTGESLTDPTISTYPNAGCVGPMATRTTGRQPFTLLFPTKSTAGSRKLIAATESRIYVLDDAAENAKIIADGMGQGISDGSCPARRFVATQNQDVVVFTNDYDEPVYWLFDQPTFGCLMQSVSKIPDMEIIGLTRAALCWTWRGVTFLADVEMDRTRYANGIIWSNKDDALSWDPSLTNTIAGRKSLSPGERILGHAEMADVCLVFTDQRIWQISVTGGEEVFTFIPRHTPLETGQGCLKYPNTLVSDGTSVWYGGADGIYKYDLYSPEPTRPEWLHLATKTIFSDIRVTACLNHVAAYYPTNPDTREIFFSWVARDDDDGFPRRTLCIDVKRERTSFIDIGFTAACYYEPDFGMSLRQWLEEQCACTTLELTQQGFGYIKEGVAKPKGLPPCDPITSIYTSNPITLDVGQPWEITTEDYTQLSSDATSFCAHLGDQRVIDVCGRCGEEKIFIFAFTDDLCLKQFADVGYREVVTNPASSGHYDAGGYWPSQAAFRLDGYDSILRTGPLHFGSPSKEKAMSFFSVEAIAEAQTVPITIGLRIGQSAQPVDPNRVGDCSLMWWIEAPKTLECQSPDAATQLEDGTRPDEGYRWPVCAEGRYLYWELTVSGKGGGVALGRVEQFVAITGRRGDV